MLLVLISPVSFYFFQCGYRKFKIALCDSHCIMGGAWLQGRNELGSNPSFTISLSFDTRPGT